MVETAKLNVITAYSSRELIETLETFPRVQGVVLDGEAADMECDQLISALRAIQPLIPIVAVCRPGYPTCVEADHILESYAPEALLALIRSLVPEESAKIEAHERELVD